LGTLNGDVIIQWVSQVVRNTKKNKARTIVREEDGGGEKEAKGGGWRRWGGALPTIEKPGGGNGQ